MPLLETTPPSEIELGQTQQTQAEIEKVFRGEAPLPSGAAPAPTAARLAPETGPQGMTPTKAPMAAPTLVRPFGEAPRLQDFQPGFAVPDVDVEAFARRPEIYGRYENLFAKPLSDIEKATSTLGRTEREFETAAGPSRTFEGIEGPARLEAIRRALGTGKRSVVEEARGLAASEYTGPTGLSPEALQLIISQMTPLEGLDPTQGAGLYSLLRETSPGATPGEIEAEVRRIRGEPEYGVAAQQFLEDIGGLRGAFAREQEEAAFRGAARREEEADISRRTRDFFTAQGTNIEDVINLEVDRLGATRKEIIDAYNAAFQSGDFSKLEDLERAHPEAFAFKTAEFAAPIRHFQAAQKSWDEVMSEFPEVKDVPLLELAISQHGRPVFAMPEEWVDAHKDLDDADIKHLARLALERQNALTTEGFSPIGPEAGSISPTVLIRGEGRDIQYNSEKPVAVGPEAFSDVMPSLLAGGVQKAPFDWQAYLGGAEQTRGFFNVPTVENVATREQKAVLNDINQIIDQSERLDPDAEPFQQAVIMADVEKWLDDNQKVKDEMKGQLTQTEKKYFEDVRDVRKRYRKAKRRARWGKVARIAVGTSTLGLTEAIPGVPQAIEKTGGWQAPFTNIATAGMVKE